MIAAEQSVAGTRFQVVDTSPSVDVVDAEYRRLLGYPRGHTPGDRSLELEAWARKTYEDIGRPWIYLREAAVDTRSDTLRIDGQPFPSPQLAMHLRQTGSRRVMLLAASAGSACEEHARGLWEQGRPDEYFFLEIMGSAVVEHLVAQANARVCAMAERNGLVAVPHYSPGYTGWNIEEQVRLHHLIIDGCGVPLPEPLEVLHTGMLRPKKALLAVIGLSTDRGRARVTAGTPCESCAYSPCNYRRARYRFGPATRESVAAPAAEETEQPRYSVNLRALQRWARERVTLEERANGSIAASFRFDGTTCSNMGVPLSFEYRVTLAPESRGLVIREATCRPVAGDDGYQSMCAYISDAEGLMRAIAAERPLVGSPLDDVFAWEREPVSTGCYCDAPARSHKWGLALEAIHFALAERATPAGANA